MSENIIPNGALPDPRPESEREKTYLSDEIAAAVAVTLFGHTKPTTVGATLYSQWYTSSCVLHGFCTQLEYEGIVAPAPNGLSQLRGYRKRSNYPNPGAAAVDAYTQLRSGQSRNEEAPVLPNHTEAMANSMARIQGTKLIKDFNYFEFGGLSFWWANGNTEQNDKAIGAVASGKAVAVFIFATEDEWSREYVEVREPSLKLENAYVRHCVCIMPNGDFTENGKQWLAVQDSAAFGGRHLRYMSRDFFNKRAYYASQVFPKGEVPAPQPPAELGKPTSPCQFGDRNSHAVKKLQKYLIDGKYLGAEYLTGNYGALTAKAVLWWQLEHWDAFITRGGVPQLLEWGGKYWGSGSIAILQ